MTNTIKLYIDESGNFGSQGRYFTICSLRCLNHQEQKLNRIVKKASKKAKEKFGLDCCTGNGEVKAALSNPIIKDYYLSRIPNGTSRIDYITADLKHIQTRLLDNQNIFYNYLLSFLIIPVISNNSDVTLLDISLDNRSIKVGSENTFEDYIKSKIWIESDRPDVDVRVHYVNSEHSYEIQAADFVANILNGFYENSEDNLVKYIRPSLEIRQRFPYQRFGS